MLEVTESIQLFLHVSTVDRVTIYIHPESVTLFLLVATPPSDIQAVHVGIGTNIARLVMVWTHLVRLRKYNLFLN